MPMQPLDPGEKKNLWLLTLHITSHSLDQIHGGCFSTVRLPNSIIARLRYPEVQLHGLALLSDLTEVASR